MSAENVLAYLFCGLFLAGYYGICGFGLFCSSMGRTMVKQLKSLRLFHKIMIVAVPLFTAALTAYWIEQNRFIYYWDYSNYWGLSIRQMRNIFDTPGSSLSDLFRAVMDSINRDDYNILLPTIIALPMKIFKHSFIRYVLINHVMFLIPAIFVQALTAAKLMTHSDQDKNAVFVTALAFAALFPANYYAMHRGFIDVAVLLPISISIYLFIDYDFTRLNISGNIAISAMFLLALLSRRYTIYYIIGYVAMLFVKAVFTFWKSGHMKNILFNFAMTGGISLGSLLVFFRPFFLRILLTDYRLQYSAYDTSLVGKVNDLAASFGYITAAILIFSGFLCFKYKQNRLNCLSLLVMMIVEICFFWQTQKMDVHHRLILNVPLFMLLVMPLGFYHKSAESKVCRIGIMACFMAWILNFCMTYLPDNSKIFPDKYTPLQREDIDVVRELAAYLNDLSADGRRIYVAASGAVLNCNILYNVNMPGSIYNAVPNMYDTNDVDLRDGFPTDFLNADIVVATDPVETHLQTGQEVVSYLSREIQDETSYIAGHFELVNQFELDNHVTAKVYVKISGWEETDLQSLKSYFRGLYPGKEALFEDRIYIDH